MATIFAFPWNQANTLVQDFIIPTIRDQVFLTNAFYYRMKDRVKHYPGGRQIVAPLAWKAEGGGGGWFSGADKLDATIRDPIQAATWVAKNAYVPISIDWEEEMQVRGPEMVRPLMEAKGEIAKNTIVDLIGTDLFNAGTDAKRVTGLQFALIDFTGAAPGVCPANTYGGIPRQGRFDGSGGGTQTNNFWIHQSDNTTFGSADLNTTAGIMGKLGQMWAKIGIASGKRPTMILSNWGSFTFYHNGLAANDRYQRPQQNSDLAKAGYENLMYKQAAWVVDERAPRTAGKVEKVYFLNEDTIKLYVHQAADMAFEEFRKPIDQMVRVAYILWRGELCIIEPRANGHFSSWDASSVS